VVRDGTVQDTVNVAGDGGHGGLQLVGHVGHEFLALVFALLKRQGHVVEGQSQLFHFHAVIVIQLDPGFQIAVGEGIGNLGHIPQRTALSSGKSGYTENCQKYHEHRSGQEDIGDPVQNLVGGRGGSGGNDDALGLFCVEDGHGNHIPLIGIEILNDAGGGVAAVGIDRLKVFPVYLPAFMVTAGEGIGA